MDLRRARQRGAARLVSGLAGFSISGAPPRGARPADTAAGARLGGGGPTLARSVAMRAHGHGVTILHPGAPRNRHLGGATEARPRYRAF